MGTQNTTKVCYRQSFAQGAGTYELLNKLLGKSPHFLFYLPYSTLKRLTALEAKCYSVKNVLPTALRSRETVALFNSMFQYWCCQSKHE